MKKKIITLIMTLTMVAATALPCFAASGLESLGFNRERTTIPSTQVKTSVDYKVRENRDKDADPLGVDQWGEDEHSFLVFDLDNYKSKLQNGKNLPGKPTATVRSTKEGWQFVGLHRGSEVSRRVQAYWNTYVLLDPIGAKKTYKDLLGSTKGIKQTALKDCYDRAVQNVDYVTQNPSDKLIKSTGSNSLTAGQEYSNQAFSYSEVDNLA